MLKIFLILFFPLTVMAHGSKHHSEMPKPSSGPVSEINNAGNQLKLNVAPLESTVGKLTSIQGSFENIEGKGIPSQITLIFRHIESNMEVFKTKFIADSGSFNIKNQFFDGAPHQVIALAEPIDEDLKSASVHMNIDVIGISPPQKVVFNTMLYLLLFAAAIMVIGYKGSLRWLK